MCSPAADRLKATQTRISRELFNERQLMNEMAARLADAELVRLFVSWAYSMSQQNFFSTIVSHSFSYKFGFSCVKWKINELAVSPESV